MRREKTGRGNTGLYVQISGLAAKTDYRTISVTKIFCDKVLVGTVFACGSSPQPELNLRQIQATMSGGQRSARQIALLGSKFISPDHAQLALNLWCMEAHRYRI